MTPLFASYRDFQRIEFKIDAIARQVGAVIKHEEFIAHMENQIMLTENDIKAQSDDLITKVTKLTEVDQALGTYIQGLKDQQTVLAQELADALANGANQDTLKAISDNMTAAAQQIDAAAAADAVFQNTAPPATPPATPPVEPPVPVPGAVPVIASIIPSVGEAAGGQTITLSGTGFSSVTGVTFGGVAAPSVAPDHDSSLSVVTPPGSGSVDVVVSNAAGDSAPVSFTFA